MPSVIVRFGADITEATAKMDVLKQQLQGFTSGVKAQSDSAASSLESIVGEAAKISAGLGLAAAASAAFSKNFDFEQAGQNLKNLNIAALGQQFTDAAKGMADMAMSSAANTAGLVGLGLAAVGAVAGFVMLKSAVDEANQRMMATAAAEAFAGNLNKIEAAAQGMAAGYQDAGAGTSAFITQLQALPGVSADDAAALQAMLASTHNYSTELESLVIGILPSFAAASGQKLPDAMAKLASVIDDPLGKIRQFAAALPNATAAEIAQADAAVRSGNVNNALAAVMTLLTGRLQQSSSQMAPLTAEHRSLAEAVGLAAAAEGGFDQAADVTASKLENLNSVLQSNVQKWKSQTNAVRAAAQTPEQIGFQSLKIVDQINPISQQIDIVSAKIKTLQADIDRLNRPSNVGSNALLDPDAIKAAVDKDKEVLAQLQQQLTDLNAKAAGGTPVQLVDLANAQKAVTAGQDQLRDSQALLGAMRAMAEQATDLQTKTQLTTQADQQALRVKQQQLDLTKAQNALAKANSDDSDGKAGVAEARANQAATNQAYAAGTQQRYEAATALANAQKALDQEVASDAANAENVAYQDELAKSQQRIALIKSEASDHLLSNGQRTSSLQAALDQEQDIEQDHFDKLKNIWEGMPAQYKKVLLEEAKADHELSDQQAQIQREAAQQAQQSWNSAMNTINSAFTSQISGLLKGTTSFRTAFKNVLTDLTGSVIKFCVEWALKQAETVAANIVGINAQTAAQVSGAAAGAAAQATGAAAGTATMVANAIKAITISAGETFAGVFGFLASFMGPAAAGPAAAAEGTVMAAASFAVGSWQLPSDMIAQVHKGEMIVPAAQTPWAQSLMSNASGSGGGSKGSDDGASGNGGGDVHNHFSPTVHINGGKNPRDTADAVHAALKDLFHRNAFSGTKARWA